MKQWNSATTTETQVDNHQKKKQRLSIIVFLLAESLAFGIQDIKLNLQSQVSYLQGN